MSSIIFFILGFLVAHIFQVTTKKWVLWDKRLGWQSHHILFGLALIVAAIFISDYRVPFIGLGLGIIVEYTLKCGFVFIKRWYSV